MFTTFKDYFDLNEGNPLSDLVVNLSTSLRKFDAKEALHTSVAFEV